MYISNGAYQFILCLYPVIRDTDLPLINPFEILRLVNDNGIVCIGMRSRIISSENAINLFSQQEFKDYGMKLMTMQEHDLIEKDFTTPDSKYSKILSKEDIEDAVSDVSIGQEKYWLAVLKKTN